MKNIKILILALIFLISNFALFAIDINRLNELKQLGIETNQLRNKVVELEKKSGDRKELNELTEKYMQNTESIEQLQKSITEDVVKLIREGNESEISKFGKYFDLVRYSNCLVFKDVIKDVMVELKNNEKTFKKAPEYISKCKYYLKQIENQTGMLTPSEDVVYLKVKSNSPASGAQKVPTLGSIEIEFDKDIKDFKMITVYTKDKKGNRINGNGNAFIEGNKIVITLTSKLKTNKLYIVEVKDVTGSNGEKLKFYSWNFKTVKRDISGDLDNANETLEKTTKVLTTVGNALKAVVPIITTVLTIVALL